MHTVERPKIEPEELTQLRRQGGENFGVLNAALDEVFSSVCAYCERQPLWRATEDGLGIQDSDLPDVAGVLFTCDHFLPRRLLCNQDPAVGLCTDGPPPHTSNCQIYDWNNLVYACPPCNAAKGGQWPEQSPVNSHGADSYINPCAGFADSDGPHAVFTYDTENGRMRVRDEVSGTTRANAFRTIADLALNGPREAIETTRYRAAERRANLAYLRRLRVEALQTLLDLSFAQAPFLIPVIIRGFIAPGARFSSICEQFVEESRYSHHLA